MKKTVLIFVILFFSISLFAQLPDTDIWLMDIVSSKDSIMFSNPVNITSRTGYDNQPAFSPDGKYLMYTSVRGDDQSDIYKYNLKTKTITQFTKTKTSEYSPTFMPDGKNISVVMVEPDSSQRLWKFPLKGGDPVCIMKDVDSIGYHCWINKDSLALVMITEPPTIYIANTKTQKTKLFSTNVGRCVQADPTEKYGFFYLFQASDSAKSWILTCSRFNHESMAIVNSNGKMFRYSDPNSIVERILPATSQDYSLFFQKDLAPHIFFGFKSWIVNFYWYSDHKSSEMDLSNYGITNITRLAISPDGKKIAIVAESKK